MLRRTARALSVRRATHRLNQVFFVLYVVGLVRDEAKRACANLFGLRINHASTVRRDQRNARAKVCAGARQERDYVVGDSVRIYAIIHPYLRVGSLRDVRGTLRSFQDLSFILATLLRDVRGRFNRYYGILAKRASVRLFSSGVRLVLLCNV